jgi:hypothetical protein
MRKLMLFLSFSVISTHFLNSTQVITLLADEKLSGSVIMEAESEIDSRIIEPKGLGGCPNGMTPVSEGSDVCIDRWEAFVVEVIGDHEYPWSPYHNPGDRKIRAKSAPGFVPQGYITQVQAKEACEEAGKRLCSDDEWVYACRSDENRIYPYGNKRNNGDCNDSRKKHPVIEFYGTRAKWIWYNLGNPGINQQDDTVRTTGSLRRCVTKTGAFDMMGNMHEWTSNRKGTFRGGFYADTKVNGQGCLYRTTAHPRTYSDYSTGFRCCAEK